MRWRSRFAACAAAVFLLCSNASPALADEPKSAEQLNAIETARAGDYAEALAVLNQLRAQNPDDASLLYDQTLVLFWAGEYQQVLESADAVDPGIAPQYVLIAVARSARNLQRFDQATTWYGYAVRSDLDNIDAIVGLAMAQSDNGDPRLARQTLELVPEASRQTVQVLIPSAYLHHNDQAFILAINEYDRILAIDPDNRDALRGKAQAMRGLLLPSQALSIEQQHPGILDEQEIARLESDELALDLRDAIETPGQRYPFPQINQALANIDARLAAEPPGSQLARYLRYDRIVGLVAAHRREEAISDYETLIANGDEPPAFVDLSVGSAYLALRQPHDALRVLRAGEAKDPLNNEIQIELFYALVELERFDEAFEIIDGLADRLEPVEQVPGARVAVPNPVKMRVDIIASIGRAYADQMQEAQDRLEALLAEAPNNAQARYELGNVYRWRGWNDRAAQEYGQVLGRFPDDEVAVRTAFAENQLALQEFPEVESTLQSLVDEFPTTVAVWNLERQWDVHEESQLLIDARYGDSSGQVFGNEQYEVNVWWFTKPLRDNYRAYVRTFDAWAQFDTGNTSRRRIATGLEYRDGPWRARGEINADRSGLDSGGAAFRADRRLSDHWSVGGTVEINSYTTPLRASRAGIESDLLLVDARYQGNESWYVGSSLGYQDYTDGNDVVSLVANGHYRLINGYFYKLDGFASVGTSSGSNNNAVYFNPSSAFEAMVGVTNIWRQYRLYDRSLTHRLSFDVGTYDQSGFGSGGIWTLGYEVIWNLSDRHGLRAGWQRSRRIYDGGPEYGTFWLLGVDARL